MNSIARRVSKGVSALVVLMLCASAQAEPPNFVLGMGGSSRDGAGIFEVLRQMGVQSLRSDAPWAKIETTQGHYEIPDWVEDTVRSAQAAGIEPLLILAYGNPLYTTEKPRTAADREAFAAYAKFVVDHFKGRVRYFELWNEWETRTGGSAPGNPVDYIELAKVAYPAVKSANPEAVLLAAGISDLVLSEVDTSWIGEFLKRGGMAHVDGLSLHPYNQPRDDGTPEYAMAMVDAIHDLEKSNTPPGKQATIYITEMGYSSYGGKLGVTEQDEANYLARFLLMGASRDFIRGIWWYDIKDGRNPDARSDHFGLLYPDLRPKPAGQMFYAVSKMIHESHKISVTETKDGYLASLEMPNGTQTVTWKKDHQDPIVFAGHDSGHSRRLVDLGISH